MSTFALAIPHCPWLADRVQTLRRLQSELGTHEPSQVFADREPNWSWSGKLWQWAYDTGCDYLVQLQDDAIVTRRFWAELQLMVDAVPDQIVGLETAHPLARHLYETGRSWCTSSDGLIGVGYVLPRGTLGELLEWRSKLPEAFIHNVTEDTLIDVFAYVTGRKVWHPIPTIIDHDVQVRSVYGNDAHPNRRPVASVCMGDTPKHESANPWDNVTDVPHLGLFYAQTVPNLARQAMPGFLSVDDQTDVRKVLSEMVASNGPMKICTICGLNEVSVSGLTGLGVCRVCLALSVRALLGVQ